MKYNPRLMAVRGLAALGVTASHAAVSVGFPLVYVLGAGISLFIFPAELGIVMFLVLSIYLLMNSLDKNADLTTYFKRRILRIWPLYFFTCGLVWWFLDRSSWHLIANLAFVGQFIPGAAFNTGENWAPHYVFWTLQIEEFAYVAFPFIHRLSTAGKERVAWGLIGFSVVFDLGLQAVYHFRYAPVLDSYWVQTIFTMPPIWVCAYGAGLLAYLGKAPSMRWSWVLIVVPMFVPGMPVYLWILMSLPFFASLTVHPLTRIPTWIPLVFVGEISYSLYLIHVLWLQEFGVVVGLIGAFASASAMELAMRPRQILSRLRGLRTAAGAVP